MSWNPPEDDGGVPITGYIIEHRDIRRSTWMKSGSVGPDITSFKAANLVEGNEYYFRVTAVNDEGQGEWLESKEIIKPERELSAPEAPVGMKILEIGKDSVTIQWQAPEDDGGSKVTVYHIRKRREGSEEWEDVATTKAYETRCTIPDLKENTGYYFSVTAENKLGEGDSLETDSPISPEKPLGKTFQQVD